MKKKLLLAFALMSIVGVTLTAKGVSAQSTQADSPVASLVKKIADKFGLNQSDVQAVFDADHAERETQMQAQYEARMIFTRAEARGIFSYTSSA